MLLRFQMTALICFLFCLFFDAHVQPQDDSHSTSHPVRRVILCHVTRDDDCLPRLQIWILNWLARSAYTVPFSQWADCNYCYGFLGCWFVNVYCSIVRWLLEDHADGVLALPRDNLCFDPE
jgi:hypothetical protein